MEINSRRASRPEHVQNAEKGPLTRSIEADGRGRDGKMSLAFLFADAFGKWEEHGLFHLTENDFFSRQWALATLHQGENDTKYLLL